MFCKWKYTSFIIELNDDWYYKGKVHDSITRIASDAKRFDSKKSAKEFIKDHKNKDDERFKFAKVRKYIKMVK